MPSSSPKYRVVMCHGVFDMLHAGHLHHLEKAKELGQYLIVSLVADKFITKPGRPIIPESERYRLLKALKPVDHVALTRSEGPIENIRFYAPNVYVRGSAYRNVKTPEDEVLKELFIPIEYTESIPPTTSEIISRILWDRKNLQFA